MDRSPVAPKIARFVGWTGSRSRPSTSGLSSTTWARVDGTVVLTAAPGCARSARGCRRPGRRRSSVTRSAGRSCARSVSRSPIGLGVLEAGEAVGGARDLDVGLGVVDELQEAPGRRAALVQLAGRVQEARAVAERRRRRASRRGPPCAARSPPRRRPRDGCDVAHHRQVARRRRGRTAARAARRRRRRAGPPRPPPGPARSRPWPPATLGWSNGLIPSTQPATAIANSAKKNSRPRSVGPWIVADDHRVAGLRERVDLRVVRRGWARRRGAGRGTCGRRRSPPGSPSGSPTIGTMPLPCLPVDSAMSCSTHRPKLCERRVDDVGELVAPGERELAPREAEPEAAVRVRGVERQAVLLGDAGAVEQAARRRRPSAPRARARSTTARCSARRCRGR